MDKHEIAHILDEIGTLLSLKGENPFKIRAYHNAARVVEALSENLEKSHLQEIPGIGESIAEKITTLVQTGHLPYYEKLKKSIPEGLLELLKIPGLGAKKVKILYQKLKIKTIEDLTKACESGRLAKLSGFGLKSQENILSGIKQIESYGKRLLWWKAYNIALPILEKLSKVKGVKKAEIAGSLRRKLETVGDLDFLVASSTPEPIMEWFVKQPWVEKVLSKGPSKTSVRLKLGIQADLKIVPEDQFAFGLLYFTGSKEHTIHMRQRANRFGFSLSEYGLESCKKKLLTEADIFKAIKLQYIPPELREDTGEIAAAEKGKIPRLVEERDIRGVFHCHTTESDGHNTLEEMAKAAQDLDFEYLGIADHSRSSYQAHGMDEKRLFKQVEKIRKINKSRKFSTYLFAGIECDILNDGSLDFPSSVLQELDYVIISIHRSSKLEEKTMTKRLIKAIENPYTTMVGHVTGRLLLQREPYALNLPKIIDACIANGKIIELNAHPNRLDMDWRFWHEAKDKGLKCSINPDAHSTSDLEFFRAGVNIARKGWLEKKDILNTLPLKKIKDFLRKSD